MGYKNQMSKMRPGPAKEGVKRKALTVLKRKRIYEQQRNSLMDQSFNLDQAHFVQGSLQDTQTTFAAMKAANNNMKQEFKKIDVDDVYDMQDDMQDMMDQHYEIQEALSRTYEVTSIDRRCCVSSLILFFFVCRRRKDSMMMS